MIVHFKAERLKKEWLLTTVTITIEIAESPSLSRNIKAIYFPHFFTMVSQKLVSQWKRIHLDARNFHDNLLL